MAFRIPIRTALAVLLVVALLGPAGAPAGAQDNLPADPAMRELILAHRALMAWQVESVRPLVERIEASPRPGREESYLVAHYRFMAGDYDAAAIALERSGGDRGERGAGFERYLLAAREITRGYVRVDGEHFSVLHPPGVDALLVPYALETLERQRAALAEDFGHIPPEGRILLEFYPTAEDLSRATGVGPEALETSGTIAICKFNRLMVTSPRALALGYRWRDTVAHEYVHLVISQVSRNTVPIWLHEGLAKMQERRWRMPPGGVLTPESESLLAQAVEENDLIPFADMHPSMALLPSQEAAALAFAEVLTMVQYLHGQGGGFPAIRQLLAALSEGATMDQAFARAFRAPMAEMEARWRGDLGRRSLAVDPELRIERLHFVRRGEERRTDPDDELERRYGISDARARGWVVVGKLLKDRNRLEAARLEFEKAQRRIGENNVRLQTLAADVYLRMGRPTDVVSSLARLGERMDGVLGAHLLLGEAYLALGRPEEAERSLIAAIGVNPFDPRVHEALVRVSVATGDTARAEERRNALALLVRHLGGGSGAGP